MIFGHVAVSSVRNVIYQNGNASPGAASDANRRHPAERIIMAKKKVKVIKAKVRATKTKPRVTNRLREFQVYSLGLGSGLVYRKGCRTLTEAENYIKRVARFHAPVIVEIDIPPMEY